MNINFDNYVLIASLNSESASILISRIPEARSTMRALSGARCTDTMLYTLRIRIGTRTTSASERLHC